MANPRSEQADLSERVSRLEEFVANLASALGAYLAAPRKFKNGAIEVAEQVFSALTPADTSNGDTESGSNPAASN